MKKLLPVLIALLLAGSVSANDPKKPYYEQKKYQKMFCVIVGIPIKYCHRKEK